MKRCVYMVCVTFLGVILCALNSVAQDPSEQSVDLIREDFSRYPSGMLTQPVGYQNPAIQEYHYLAHRGVPLVPWSNAICYLDAWKAGTQDGQPYLDQVLMPNHRRMGPKLLMPIFLTGDPEWQDYEIEISVRPESTEQFVGLIFRYHTNRHHYIFGLEGGKTARLAIKQPIEDSFRIAKFEQLEAVPFEYSTDKFYRLRVQNNGKEIQAWIDDKLLIQAQSDQLIKGKIGFGANCPARFQDFRCSVTTSVKRSIEQRISAREQELARLQSQNPRPKLWRKIETPQFGAGRNLRFGDLDGDGAIDILIGQNIPQTDTDAAIELSCLTAINLDGKVLWQIGSPDPTRGLLTSDTPFQIHDLDGDGTNEVILARGHKLQVLNGKTGEEKLSVPTPKVESFPAVPQKVPENWPTNVSSGDCLAFADFEGKGRASNLIIKDRYWNFWVYNEELNLLWQGQGMLGHYPFVVPGESGQNDQLATGYALWNADGRQLWSVDQQLRDHADSIAVVNLTDNPSVPPLAYYCCSDDGVLIVDMDGIIRKQIRLGHAQSAAIGKFRMDLPGLQYMCINYWKNPGIMTLLSYDGEILAQEEPTHYGSPMLPVNWRGDGQEFVLLNGSAKEGGLLDGHLRRVVLFPDDGHPDLAANVLDLTGDARDEIILWDTQRIWIYTQDQPFAGSKIYVPRRNPDYNESNYRTNISLPPLDAEANRS